nr:hypothetical protein [Tanacetum cinerariifolium]
MFTGRQDLMPFTSSWPDVVDALFDFWPKDPRLPLLEDVVPRKEVHRELPDDLPEDVSPMSCVVTERRRRASIVPLKPDRLRAKLICDLP